MSKKQANSYCFTLNNYTDDDIAAIMEYIREYNEDDCQNWEYENPIFCYICWGFEVGKQGTPHLQGYIVFYKRKTIGAARTVFSEILGHKRVHLEYSKGTPQQAIAYCEKEGDFVEWGGRPSQGRAAWDKIEAAMKDPKSNPHVYNQYAKTYKAVQIAEASKKTTRKLRMISEDDKFDIANATEGEILMITEPDDINTYNLEKTIFVNEFVTFHNILKCWYGGYPKKIKRGYELIPFNPEVIYLCYEDERGKSNIEKKYLPMLDGDWQENYTETPI